MAKTDGPTVEVTVTEIAQTHAEFWKARAEHRESVAAKFDEVQREIEAGVLAGLYEDGITLILQDSRNSAIALASRLREPTIK